MSTFTMLAILCMGNVLSQPVTLQQVVGSFGHMTPSRAMVSMSATAGECMTSTETSDNYALTQGFHQPRPKTFIDFELNTTNASCPTSTDGSAEVVKISGCEPPYTITWSFGSSGAESGRLGPGTYAVTVTTGLCSITKDFTIGTGSETDCRLLFFKAFSPNGDGTNDKWEIENIQRPEFSDNKIEIFNRWGQLIWSGHGYNNSDMVWNGQTQNGDMLPDGTYFYVARVADIMYKGFIELTR